MPSRWGGRGHTSPLTQPRGVAHIDRSGSSLGSRLGFHRLIWVHLALPVELGTGSVLPGPLAGGFGGEAEMSVPSWNPLNSGGEDGGAFSHGGAVPSA